MRQVLKALEMAELHLHLEDEVLERAYDDLMVGYHQARELDADKELRLDEINRRSDQINEALRAINKVIRSCEEESVRRRG